MAQLNINQRQAGDVSILDLDGEVRIGDSSTALRSAIRNLVAGEAGFLPYVYLERVDDALGAAAANGGEVVTPPYPEGDLWVATFRDPAGNVIGVWQRGPRG